MSELQYKASNNKYKDCPPRMSDGRHFTDYRQNRDRNNEIRHSNKILNSVNYRMFFFWSNETNFCCKCMIH